MSSQETASQNGEGAERRQGPDLAALLKATAETMAAVNAATARLEGELTALRAQPRRKAVAFRS